MKTAPPHPADRPRLIAGAMSGTSADGVDVAIVEITGHRRDLSTRLLHHHVRAYEPALKQAIFAARGVGSIPLRDLAKLARDISLSYAAAVRAALDESKLTARDLTAIAAHGQTLFHDPPNTIQWLDPALLAYETGCAVISDFRRADCAAGGQGAPLVPFADWVLFRHASKKRILLNIGGIANLTYVPPAASQADTELAGLLAFDTGPGNCISDALCRELDPSGPGFDADGKLAATSAPCPALVAAFLEDPYFSRPPPKSTDGPEMIAAFARARAATQKPLSLGELLASACMATAQSIEQAISRFLPIAPDELIVSGGGTLNHAIMHTLRNSRGILAQSRVITTDTLGIPSAAKEAIAFAILGAASLDGEPANAPSATGARRRVVLGSITPADGTFR